MCYLEQMKYDAGRECQEVRGWTERRRWVYHLRDKELNLRETGNREPSPGTERGAGWEEKRRGLCTCSVTEHKILLSHVCWLPAHQAGLFWLYLPTLFCQVVILLPINTPLICCSVLTISTMLLSFKLSKLLQVRIESLKIVRSPLFTF